MLLILCSSRCFGVLVCPSAWRSPHGSSLARLYNGINGFYAHMMLYNGPGIHIEFGMEQTSVPRAYQQLEKMKKTVHRILIQFCKMLSAKQGECRNGKKAEMEGTHVFHSVCLRFFLQFESCSIWYPLRVLQFDPGGANVILLRHEHGTENKCDAFWEGQ